MIGKLLFGMCGVALLTATAVVAQPSDGGATGEANKQICRSSPDTGSRLGRTRACHTAQEWAELRRQTRQNIDRIQTRQAMNSDPNGQ
jgi:hypothetical protein